MGTQSWAKTGNLYCYSKSFDMCFLFDYLIILLKQKTMKLRHMRNYFAVNKYIGSSG